ncbi:hypothetical protein P8452_57782 [Trifolium repens]|nr:hypothetical protein P8452_57782 [Trifolium repens]
MAKTMLVMFLSAILICTFFSQDVEAQTHIGYGAIGRDRGPGCGKTHLKGCKEQPVNPYTRGCEKENKCRGGPPSAEKDERFSKLFPIPHLDLPRKVHY